MRECLIFLTHLDYEDMENIMIEKLQKQVCFIYLFIYYVLIKKKKKKN